ncbi:MAG TPA: hypothetical protein VI583_11110 [Cyclobacteriaceae bacterium]|nr:hypothetical protein [Cyclobacteriaceae bacterium]
MKKRTLTSLLCCTLLISGPWSGTFAQHIYFNPVSTNRTHLGLRYLRPVGNGIELRGLSGTYELSLLQSFSRAGLIISMPYMRYSNKNEYFSDSEGSLGNLFVGLQIPSRDKKINFTFGMALPTASTEKWSAQWVGWSSDFMNLYKYSPETLTLYFNLRYNSDLAKPLFFSVETGPNLLFNTGDSASESEVYVHYGLQGGYNMSKARFLVELYGFMITTESELDFGERTYHQISLGAEIPLGKVEPGIFYNFYLDEGLSEINVLGLKLDFNLN